MKAVMINPFERSVTEVDCGAGEYEDIVRVLGCDGSESFDYHGCSWWVDEFGKQKYQTGFNVRGLGDMKVMGKCVILGYDVDADELYDCPKSVESIKATINFFGEYTAPANSDIEQANTTDDGIVKVPWGKKLKAIMIDATKHTIEEIECTGEEEEIRPLLKNECINHLDCRWYGDRDGAVEGKISVAGYWYEVEMYGKIIVIGYDGETNQFYDCPLSVDDVEFEIDFHEWNANCLEVREVLELLGIN